MFIKDFSFWKCVFGPQDHESLLFHAEEEEAEARDAEQDVQLFKSACSSIRDNMKFIQGMKKQKAVSVAAEKKHFFFQLIQILLCVCAEIFALFRFESSIKLTQFSRVKLSP